MHYNTFLRKWSFPRAATLAGVLAMAAAHGADVYDGTYLAIPSMAIGAGSYSDVIVTPEHILSVLNGPPGGSEDRYDPASQQLKIPAVVAGGLTYTNVTITIHSLISIRSVTGVDTYNGVDLLIPSVQVLGGAIYYNVAIKVGSIISTGGAMPAAIRDVYDPSTGRLTIAAIQVANRVYTNAIVTIGSLVAVGGRGIPVPDVVGDTQAAATDAITSVGLTVGTVTTQSSATVASGDVISETPPSGTGVAPGFAVDLVVSSGGTAPAESLLYSFGAAIGSSDGHYPNSLIQGSDRNLYGTTQSGGSSGTGTIFKLTLAGAESILYSFGTSTAIIGYVPGSLFQWSDGNFYGITNSGGTYGTGIVFKVTADGTESVLHSFGNLDSTGALDGDYPTGIVAGNDGNFYGTTSNSAAGPGTIFKITPQGTETVLHNFGSAAGDGGGPVGAPVQGNDGNFYGTTFGGGANNTGTVYRFTPAGAETVLYSFGPASGTDGQGPAGALIFSTDLNFYGMTRSGGANKTGTIFKVSFAGAETVLYSFGAPVDATNPVPEGALIQASNGNFYGGTQHGGTLLSGTVFQMTPAGTVTILHSFTAQGVDAAEPGALIQASDGNLYGTASSGGANGSGAIFKITP